MKRLLLLRHAKAVPSDSSDHSRRLTPGGTADAASVGRAIIEHGWRPEAAIVSDARRTRETYESLALSPQTVLRIEGALYDASPATILRAIGGTEEAVGSLLVVGHNPGIALTARTLATSGEDDDIARLGRSFPTASLAVLRFEAAGWADLAEHGGLLEDLLSSAEGDG